MRLGREVAAAQCINTIAGTSWPKALMTRVSLMLGMMMLLILQCVAYGVDGISPTDYDNAEAADVPQDEALNRLLQVFGMDHPGRRERHHPPPQYMLDLYNAIADSSGITRTPHPYHANIVRSFPDKDISHNQHFFFNITSSIPVKEQVLEAEFHLYKTKSRERLRDNLADVRSHLLEVRIYQVMMANATYTEEGNKLLDVRRISAHSSGWEVFYVKPAALDWLKDATKNYGLLMTARTMLGTPADFRSFKFAKRHQHHMNKLPILVLFTDDGRPKKSSHYPSGFRRNGDPELVDRDSSLMDTKSSEDTIYENEMPQNGTNDLFWYDTTNTSITLSREERSLEAFDDAPSSAGCTRLELHVDFEKIGWSSWIISPKWYNAYFCKGECSFPLGQNQWPTNHATVQSIVHELRLSPDVGTPCCVPSKLYSINLLYFDEHENVILKQYDDMVAASCGCH